MSLYPGNPREDSGKYFLDDKALKDNEALNDSMAKAIEEAMKDVFSKVKGEDLPAAGREDLRLLFVAISRGILQYLEDHQEEIFLEFKVSHESGPTTAHNVEEVNLNVKINK